MSRPMNSDYIPDIPIPLLSRILQVQSSSRAMSRHDAKVEIVNILVPLYEDTLLD
jgi:hypothetical protein